MQFIDTDGGEYFVNFGHKVELVLISFFQGYFDNGEFMVDKELKWLSATSDSVFTLQKKRIPIEIKAIQTEKGAIDVAKTYYHQLNILMRIYQSDFIILIIYRKQNNRFAFYRVNKDENYDSIYIPLIEKGFFKHLLGYVCNRLDEAHLQDVMKTSRFQEKFCKYYKSDLNELLCVRKKSPKNISISELKLTDIISKHQLRELSDKFIKTYFHRVRRTKLFYWQFEKLFKERTTDLFRDFEIQHLSNALVQQITSLISK